MSRLKIGHYRPAPALLRRARAEKPFGTEEIGHLLRVAHPGALHLPEFHWGHLEERVGAPREAHKPEETLAWRLPPHVVPAGESPFTPRFHAEADRVLAGTVERREVPPGIGGDNLDVAVGGKRAVHVGECHPGRVGRNWHRHIGCGHR